MYFLGHFVLLLFFLGLCSPPNPARAQANGADIASGSGIVGGVIGSAVRNETSRTSSVRVRPGNMSIETARGIQRNLNTLGFSVGAVDGIIGPMTRQQIMNFQRAIGSRETGALSEAEIGKLNRAADVYRSSENLEYALAFARSRSARGLVTVASPTSGSPQAAPVVVARLRPKPTRKFTGPEGFPPEDFRGYGVIAFKSTVSDYDKERFEVICNAYASAMNSASEDPTPDADQFVTIWPVSDPAVAKALNDMPQNAATSNCPLAIKYYDKNRADEALDAARKAGFSESGVGPFLIGWLPAASYGKDDALILFLDLSRVTTYPQAQSLFSEWKRDIESDPDLLQRGFSVELLRRKIRRWLDQNGDGFLRMVNG